MSVTSKLRTASSPTATAELFDRLGVLFRQPERERSSAAIKTTVRKSFTHLGGNISSGELVALRNVVDQLAAEVDQLDQRAAHSPTRESDPQGWAVRQALEAARHHCIEAMTTTESIAAGDTEVARAQGRSRAEIQGMIQRGELITSGQLQTRLGVGRQAISGAIKAGRMFAIVGPGGENFYPAFYADHTIDRRALEKVSKELGTLPASSKLFFFTNKSTQLGSSPVEALRDGRLADVITAARGFVER